VSEYSVGVFLGTVGSNGYLADWKTLDEPTLDTGGPSVHPTVVLSVELLPIASLPSYAYK
jgi:hypothetical protein